MPASNAFTSRDSRLVLAPQHAPSPPSGDACVQAVVAEFYDEVVFTDPFEDFYNTLMKGQALVPQKKHEHQEHFSSFSDGESLQRLASAREWVHNQLRGEQDSTRSPEHRRNEASGLVKLERAPVLGLTASLTSCLGDVVPPPCRDQGQDSEGGHGPGEAKGRRERSASTSRTADASMISPRTREPQVPSGGSMCPAVARSLRKLVPVRVDGS